MNNVVQFPNAKPVPRKQTFEDAVKMNTEHKIYDTWLNCKLLEATPGEHFIMLDGTGEYAEKEILSSIRYLSEALENLKACRPPLWKRILMKLVTREEQ